jgi:hypothetical protein
VVQENRRARGSALEEEPAAAPFSFNCFSSGRVAEDNRAEELAVFPTGSRPEGEGVVLRGVLWIQRERLFTRWKERFCILTRDYLQCFKKGSTQLTEMGPFLFKVSRQAGYRHQSMDDILSGMHYLFISKSRGM